MIRALLGILVATILTPLVLCGLLIRFTVTTRTGRALAVLALISSCAACGAVLERDSRQCYRQAYTVPNIEQCARQYPQHRGTITDRIAQPIGELERLLSDRKRQQPQTPE